jgi:hypothetical protein
MVEGPHMIFIEGILANPGDDNDYTLSVEPTYSNIVWHNELIENYIKRERNFVITTVRLDNGKRWAFSNKEGVFINTMEKEDNNVL